MLLRIIVVSGTSASFLTDSGETELAWISAEFEFNDDSLAFAELSVLDDSDPDASFNINEGFSPFSLLLSLSVSGRCCADETLDLGNNARRNDELFVIIELTNLAALLFRLTLNELRSKFLIKLRRKFETLASEESKNKNCFN